MNTEVQQEEVSVPEGDAIDAQDNIEPSEAEAFAEAVGEEYDPAAEDELEGSEDVRQEEQNEYGIPADVLEKIQKDAADEAEKRMSGRIRNLEGNYGGLKQKLESMATAKAAADDSGAETPTASQIREAAVSGPKMAALKQDYPDFAAAMEEAVAGVKTPDMTEFDNRLKAAEESTANEVQTMRELQRLDRAHTDWEDVVESDQYRNWLYNQPQDLQNIAATSNDSRDAIEILNRFKDSMTSKPDLTATSRQNQSRLEKATAPTTGNTVTRRHAETAEEAFLKAAGT